MAPTSHLADDLTRFHRIVTRALTVARGRGAGFLADGFPGGTVQAGFVTYVRCLLTALRGHHDIEDTTVFPRLRGIAGVPFDRLEADHHELVQSLDAAALALEPLQLGPLLQTLARLEQQWRAHIEIEERHLTAAAIDGVISPAEIGEIGRAVGEHAARTSKPEALVVPFILFNLDPADRAEMAKKLPPIVTGTLIPGPWKKDWEPMSPFLLD